MDFEAFVEGRGDALVRFAYLLCRDAGRAEDLVQEALFRSHRRWRRAGDVEFPEAYVRQVILREFLGWRRLRPSSEVVGLPLVDAPVSDHADAVAAQDVTWRLMGALPPRQRAVLVLRYYQDLPDAEIATLLGCAQATVRSLAARALATLRADAHLDQTERTP